MESEEGDPTEERRGSLPTIFTNTNRRGSRLQDILRYNQERKRKRDSQGFVWKRMPTQSFEDIQPYEEPTEELPPNLVSATLSPEQIAAMAAALSANSSSQHYIGPESINDLPYGKGGYKSYIHALPFATVIQPEHMAAFSVDRRGIQPEHQGALSHGRSDKQSEHQAQGRSEIQPENLAATKYVRTDVMPENRPATPYVRSGIQPEYLANLAPGDRDVTGPYPQDVGGTKIKTIPVISPVPPERKISQNRKDTLTTSPSGRVSSPSGRGSNPPQSYIQIEGNGRHNYGLPIGRPIGGPPKKSPKKSHQSKIGNSGGDSYMDGNKTSRRRNPPDPDSVSLQSEHSFRTCSSEPELPLVPRAVSDNYKYSNEIERPAAASVKTLQQKRYSNALDAAVGTSAGTPVTNRSGAQTSLSGKASSSGSPLPYTTSPSNRTTSASNRTTR